MNRSILVKSPDPSSKNGAPEIRPKSLDLYLHQLGLPLQLPSPAVASLLTNTSRSLHMSFVYALSTQKEPDFNKKNIIAVCSIKRP